MLALERFLCRASPRIAETSPANKWTSDIKSQQLHWTTFGPSSKWGSSSYRNLELAHTHMYRYIKVSVQYLQKGTRALLIENMLYLLSSENTPQIVTGSFGIHFRIFQLREKLYTSSLEVNPLQSKITDCNSRPLLERRNWSNKGPLTELDVIPSQSFAMHLCFRVSRHFR